MQILLREMATKRVSEKAWPGRGVSEGQKVKKCGLGGPPTGGKKKESGPRMVLRWHTQWQSICPMRSLNY